MTDEQFNRAVDLWNNGKNLREIAEILRLPFYALHPIMTAATREALRMARADLPDNQPVRLAHRPPAGTPGNRPGRAASAPTGGGR